MIQKFHRRPPLCALSVAGALALTLCRYSPSYSHFTLLLAKALLHPPLARDLMARADPGAIFMHCLPAHRGMEVSSGVLDSEKSVVFEQAENRLHVQNAILAFLVGGVTL